MKEHVGGKKEREKKGRERSWGEGGREKKEEREGGGGRERGEREGGRKEGKGERPFNFTKPYYNYTFSYYSEIRENCRILVQYLDHFLSCFSFRTF